MLTKRNLIAELADMLSGRVAFERVLAYGLYEVLRDGGLDLVPTSGAVEKLRAVKEEAELEQLRKACAITDRMFERLDRGAVRRAHEREISWEIVRLFHEEGGQELSFDSIVGSGPTGARPHARAGDRKIGAGELVVIDTGTSVGGYTSDYTRTFATGPLDAEAKEAYDTVLRAQQAALDGIRAGISGVDARRARAQRHRREPVQGQARPRARARARPRHPRGAAPLDRVERHPRAGQRRHGRAGRLPRGPVRHPDRGRRRRHRRRNREPDGLPEGPDRGRLGSPVLPIDRGGDTPMSKRTIAVLTAAVAVAAAFAALAATAWADDPLPLAITHEHWNGYEALTKSTDSTSGASQYKNPPSPICSTTTSSAANVATDCEVSRRTTRPRSRSTRRTRTT